MDFFTNPDILLGDKLLEILYIVMGLVLIYTGVRNLTDTRQSKSMKHYNMT